MIQKLLAWLDKQRISYIPVDAEVVDIPGFGRLFTADLSGVESISAVTAINLSSI